MPFGKHFFSPLFNKYSIRAPIHEHYERRKNMKIHASLRINHKCETCSCSIGAEKKGTMPNDNCAHDRTLGSRELGLAHPVIDLLVRPAMDRQTAQRLCTHPNFLELIHDATIR